MAIGQNLNLKKKCFFTLIAFCISVVFSEILYCARSPVNTPISIRERLIPLIGKNEEAINVVMNEQVDWSGMISFRSLSN